MPAISQAIPGITALQAVVLARRAAQPPKWHLGYFSSLGVTRTVMSDLFQQRSEALMLPNGIAGQWVAEFFMPIAQASSAARLDGLHRLRSVIVTSDGAYPLPDQMIELPADPPRLGVDALHGLGAARQLAIRHARGHFDLVSVASLPQADGRCDWGFTFYRLDRQDPGAMQELGKLQVSSDGKLFLKC
jgi:hypothetical protein